MVTREAARTLLERALQQSGADFRRGQWEAIEAIARHRSRLLVVERTGWGKSMVYFLSTKLLRANGAGPTLLVSPLLSLMRNQVAAARNLGLRAETINSTNIQSWPEIEQRLLAESFDILLVSPERLANDGFVTRCLIPIARRVGLLVVDEAHCISDWGHDFRPDYRRILRVLQALPRNVPVLATTATANDRVIEDIAQQLGRTFSTQRGPLARSSLRLQNIELRDQAHRLAWLAHHLPRIPGAGIVYTLTVADSERVAEWLQRRGIRASAYHARLDPPERELLEERLLRNEVKALVATVALGMGFDKPDLGFVVHFQRPASVVHYYQQVGRAGRALDNAYGVLLSGAEDDLITEYFIRRAFPLAEEVDAVLNLLRASPKPLAPLDIEAGANLPRHRIKQILKFLAVESPSPIERQGHTCAATAVRWRMPVGRIDRITTLRYREQERMRQYMESRKCLMQFLAEELNDPSAQPCGRCAICLGELLPVDFPARLATLAAEFLREKAILIRPRQLWPDLSEIPHPLRMEAGRALCLWGDNDLGRHVRAGKYKGYFDDILVDAAAMLIEKRWAPRPKPEWVTSVPSLRHPELVAGFARRLAARLRLPYVETCAKARETEPQKAQKNSHHQVHNIEGAFALKHAPPSGPVLLVDDLVDSRWTLTVIAALLKQNGAGLIYPFALADSCADDRS